MDCATLQHLFLASMVLVWFFMLVSLLLTKDLKVKKLKIKVKTSRAHRIHWLRVPQIMLWTVARGIKVRMSHNRVEPILRQRNRFLSFQLYEKYLNESYVISCCIRAHQSLPTQSSIIKDAMVHRSSL